MATKVNGELQELRAKARLYDELVEQLEQQEREVERLRRQHTRDGIDPVWREIANDLAGAHARTRCSGSSASSTGASSWRRPYPARRCTRRRRRWNG